MTEKIIQRNGNNWRHGYNRTPTYVSWSTMIQRCYNPNRNNYERYGAKGIAVCEQWRDRRTGFKQFLMDMGERPYGCSLEREKNHLGYSRENCKWATDKEQGRNQRSNHTITYNNETLCLAEWGERTGKTGRAIYKRLKRGWSIEDAINKPLRVTKLTHKS